MTRRLRESIIRSYDKEFADELMVMIRTINDEQYNKYCDLMRVGGAKIKAVDVELFKYLLNYLNKAILFKFCMKYCKIHFIKELMPACNLTEEYVFSIIFGQDKE